MTLMLAESIACVREDNFECTLKLESEERDGDLFLFSFFFFFSSLLAACYILFSTLILLVSSIYLFVTFGY